MNHSRIIPEIRPRPPAKKCASRIFGLNRIFLKPFKTLRGVLRRPRESLASGSRIPQDPCGHSPAGAAPRATTEVDRDPITDENVAGAPDRRRTRCASAQPEVFLKGRENGHDRCIIDARARRPPRDRSGT
jgi:hypothetical protein